MPRSSQASTCSVIRIDKLVFASIAGMSLSKKRREKLVSLTEAEGPDQIEPRLKVGSFTAMSPVLAEALELVNVMRWTWISRQGVTVGPQNP